MSLINTTIPFSGSVSSMPILVNTNTSPGTLIHKSEPNDQDFIWLWISNNIFVPYTKVICVQLLRGTPELGYQKDALITVPLNSRTLVDNGILITAGLELRAHIVPDITTAPEDAFAIVNGYVHRRSDV